MNEPVAALALPPLLEADLLQQGPTALVEARRVGANAVVLSRPPIFAPGPEAVRLEAAIRPLPSPAVLRLETVLGDFALRLSDALGGAKAATQIAAGQRVLLTISPSGASAKVEILPGPAALPPRAAPALSPALVSLAATSNPPAAAAAAGLGQTRSETAGQGVKGLADLEPSILGSERRAELWLQSGPYNTADNRAAARSYGETARSFQLAKGPEAPGALQQIAQSFAEGAQPYQELVRALAGLAPVMLERSLGIAPRLNSGFGIALLFFLTSLRTGGLRGWLGEVVGREIHLHDAGEIFDHLDEQVLPRVRNLGRLGYWETTIVPVVMGRLSHLVWAVRKDLGPPPGTPGRPFALQMVLPRLGPLQVTGLSYGVHLNLTILTLLPLPKGLVKAVVAQLPASAGRFGLRGAVTFSNDPGQWLPFLESDTVNHLF